MSISVLDLEENFWLLLRHGRSSQQFAELVFYTVWMHANVNKMQSDTANFAPGAATW